MRRTLESAQWGLFCTSSWTWCIGMYLPFIMLRLWGWPGFWAFFVPNVLGCALFGFVLDADRSRRVVAQLGWACAWFGAVTVAYQCWFAGWAAQSYGLDPAFGATGTVDAAGAARAVASVGVPLVLAAAGALLAARGDAFWRTAGTAVTMLSGLVVLLPGGVAPGIAGGATEAGATGAALEPQLDLLRLGFAFPTIAAGFLLSPYLDLTFHRAAQQAPSPRIAFLTFGLAFAAMLLLVASFHDPATGAPRVGPALLVLWGVQLVFTVGAHARELFNGPSNARVPLPVTGVLVLAALALAWPGQLFGIGEALRPGEPTYLGFLGAYGLVFPVLVMLERRPVPRALTAAIIVVGAACYLLGAWEFMTWLMPVPILAAAVASRVTSARRPAAR